MIRDSSLKVFFRMSVLGNFAVRGRAPVLPSLFAT